MLQGAGAFSFTSFFFGVAPFSLSCLRILLTTVPVMIMKEHLSVMILLCGHKNLSSNLYHGACWGSAGADAWTAEAGAAPGPDAAQPAGNTGKSNQMSTNVFFVFIVFFELCLIYLDIWLSKPQRGLISM